MVRHGPAATVHTVVVHLLHGYTTLAVASEQLLVARVEEGSLALRAGSSRLQRTARRLAHVPVGVARDHVNAITSLTVKFLLTTAAFTSAHH